MIQEHAHHRHVPVLAGDVQGCEATLFGLVDGGPAIQEHTHHRHVPFLAQAMCSAVQPVSLAWLMDAPRSRSSRTTASLPKALAKIKGAQPLLLP